MKDCPPLPIVLGASIQAPVFRGDGAMLAKDKIHRQRHLAKKASKGKMGIKQDK